MALTDKLNAIGREVMTLSGSSDKVTLDQMASYTQEANNEVNTQEELIQQITEALRGKVIPGPSGETVPFATALIRRGTGHINSGIDAANSNLTIEVQYEFETLPTGYWYLIRAYTNETTNSTRILHFKNTNTYCCLNSPPNSSLNYARTLYTNVVYTDILKPNNSTTFSYTTNGVQINKTRTNGTALENVNLEIFNRSTDDGVAIKLYYLKIYDGEVLVRDFIPYIKSNGECGLYDNITKQFYGNAGGGTFEAEFVDVGGGNVPVEPVIEPLTIIENNTYIAPSGIDGYSPITVNVPIPDGYIVPSGTLDITENGTYDVTEKASVNVNVEASGGSDDMAGALADKTITEFYSDNCAEIGEYSFRACKDLKTLVAPNAESVGAYALYNCSALKSIVLPSVTTIATNSFREASNLEVIDLPKLTAIPATAFYGCRGLKALILRSETIVPLANTSAFTQCYRILGTKNSGYNPNGEKLGFFYVPKSLLSDDDETMDYRRATNWSVDTLVTQFRAIEDYPEICGG